VEFVRSPGALPRRKCPRGVTVSTPSCVAGTELAVAVEVEATLSKRISLTMPVINANRVSFLVSGQNKADAFKTRSSGGQTRGVSGAACETTQQRNLMADGQGRGESINVTLYLSLTRCHAAKWCTCTSLFAIGPQLS
jgi:Glucosamine-6-phosphate isomerases/6-phosphogluconolactonase